MPVSCRRIMEQLGYGAVQFFPELINFFYPTPTCTPNLSYDSPSTPRCFVRGETPVWVAKPHRRCAVFAVMIYNPTPIVSPFPPPPTLPNGLDACQSRTWYSTPRLFSLLPPQTQNINHVVVQRFSSLFLGRFSAELDCHSSRHMTFMNYNNCA